MKNKVDKRIQITKNYSMAAIAIACLIFCAYCYLLQPVLSYSRVKIVAALVLFFVLFIGRSYCYSTKNMILGIAVVFLTLFNSFVKANSLANFFDCFEVLSWIVCVLLMLMILLTDKEIKLVLMAAKYASLITSIDFLARNDWFTSRITYVLAFGGIGRNMIINFTLAGLTITLIQILFCKAKRINYIYLAILLIAVLQANSRAIFLAFAMSLGCIVMHYILSLEKEIRWKKAITIILLILLLIIIWLLFMPQSYIDRLWNPKAYGFQESDRVELWKTAIEMSNAPLLGMGPNYSQTIASHQGYGAHNLFIDTYVNSGIVVSLLTLFFIITFIKKDLLLLAFFSTPFVEMMVESGRSTGTWGAIVIITLITNRAIANNKSFAETIKSILD